MKSLLSDISEHSGKSADGQETDRKGPAAADAFMFSFFSVRDAMNCCKVFAGAGPVESSLYYLREDDTYFLIIRRTENTPEGFEKCVLSANEFGELVTSEQQYIAYVTEHGMCIAEEHAIEMFLNVIPGLKMPAAPKTEPAQKKREEGKGRRRASAASRSSEEA
jgi:negative regulator of genetic competence, sporulation and motility